MPELLAEEDETVIEQVADKKFVVTPLIQDVVDQAMAYLKADFPIHFCGPAGTGKSALAMYVAAQFKRPIVLIHGDEEFGTSDLVGGEAGFRSKRVRDQYIHSVIKVEEDVSKRWVDYRLTTACRHGFTLVYDEFTRSKPTANNVFLSVLEERMLDMPTLVESEREYVRVAPTFRAIFTSNPSEYAGVHRAQDALVDRLVTFHLDHFDKETEIAITVARAGISEADAKKIVNIVQDFRAEEKAAKAEHTPSVRECIKIAKTLKVRKASPRKGDEFFRKLCYHALTNEPHRVSTKGVKSSAALKLVDSLIAKYC